MPDEVVAEAELAQQRTEVEREEVVAAEFVVPVEDARCPGAIALAEQEAGEPGEVVEAYGVLVDAVVLDRAGLVEQVLADELLVAGKRLVQLGAVAPRTS